MVRMLIMAMGMAAIGGCGGGARPHGAGAPSAGPSTAPLAQPSAVPAGPAPPGPVQANPESANPGPANPVKAARPGISLTPAVFLVQGLPPGREVRLADTAPATVLTIANHGGDALTFAVSATSPTAAGMTAWERGYEPAPASGWFRVEPAQVTVPAGGSAQVALIATVPDGEDAWNRKLAMGIGVVPVGEGGSVLFGLAGRMLVETAVRPAARSGAPIALDPPLIDAPPLAAGGTGAAQVEVRNGTSAAVSYRLQRLIDVVPMADTHARFASPGFTALVSRSWLTAQPGSFNLEPGASTALRIVISVPEGTAPGRYEELLFIASTDGAPTGNQREPGGATTFVRVRITVAATP